MFDWMAWTTPVAVFFTCIVLMLIGMTVWNQIAHHHAQGLFAHCHHGGSPFIGLLSAAYVNLIFVGLSGRMAQWLSLENEPSVWISFVLSMALLGLILRKG